MRWALFITHHQGVHDVLEHHGFSRLSVHDVLGQVSTMWWNHTFQDALSKKPRVHTCFLSQRTARVTLRSAHWEPMCFPGGLLFRRLPPGASFRAENVTRLVS